MPNLSHRRTTMDRNGVFRTTDWTEIFNVRSDEEPCRRAALEKILVKYWRPVYCFLRCRGYAHEEAKDLTQGFFCEVVLGRNLVQQADRAKGRFRTFLTTALRRYVADVWEASTAKRRMPEGGMISLQDIDWVDIPEPVHYATPIQVFDYAWASALLDEVIGEVERECRETGRAVYWEVFRARVLAPIMDDAEPPSRERLCREFHIQGKNKVSNMIVTVKRLFRAVLRRQVRFFVDSDSEVDGEIARLMRVSS